MSNNSFLGKTGNYDSLGVLNGFRQLSELYIKQLVSEGKWFTLCHKIDEKQVDIMSITNDKGEKLGSVIGEMFEEGSYRNSIYRYMMMNFMCYVEVPVVTYKTDTGDYRNTFNKMLVTSSIEVMAEWLGVNVEDLDNRYKTRVFSIGIDDGDDEIAYVKLTESKDGKRKITVPRKDLDISIKGTRVVPLFMLKTGVDELYSRFKEGIVRVSFLKDNGMIRDIFTTANAGVIKDIYGKGNFYDDAVMNMYTGDFLRNNAISRGYIRVPEIGGSKYDGATRSINYARIVDIDYEEEPNLSFVNIDLGTVLEGFQEGVVKYTAQASDIIEMLEEFGIDGGCWSNGKYKTRDLVSLITWSDERKLLLSTVFLRDLCLFMLANPQWFGDFTGEPKYRFGGGSNEDVGIG